MDVVLSGVVACFSTFLCGLGICVLLMHAYASIALLWIVLWDCTDCRVSVCDC